MPSGYATARTLGSRAFFTKSYLENGDIFSLVYFFLKNHPRNHICDHKDFIFAAFLETGFVFPVEAQITCDTKLFSWNKNWNAVKKPIFAIESQTDHSYSTKVDCDQTLIDNSERALDIFSKYKYSVFEVSVYTMRKIGKTTVNRNGK